MKPAFKPASKEQMDARTASIKQGREQGAADARNGNPPDMRTLGGVDRWRAHGYSEGYAQQERAVGIAEATA